MSCSKSHTYNHETNSDLKMSDIKIPTDCKAKYLNINLKVYDTKFYFDYIQNIENLMIQDIEISAIGQAGGLWHDYKNGDKSMLRGNIYQCLKNAPLLHTLTLNVCSDEIDWIGFERLPLKSVYINFFNNMLNQIVFHPMTSRVEFHSFGAITRFQPFSLPQIRTYIAIAYHLKSKNNTERWDWIPGHYIYEENYSISRNDPAYKGPFYPIDDITKNELWNSHFGNYDSYNYHKVLENNQEKIIERYGTSENYIQKMLLYPYFIGLNSHENAKKLKIIEEELMMKIFHPTRFEYYLNIGYNINDDTYENDNA